MAGNEIKYEVKKSGRLLLVYNDRVVFSRKGVLGSLLWSLKGDKTIFYQNLTSVEFKNCGLFTGFIEFIFPGSGDEKGDAISGINNQNRFNFSRFLPWRNKKLGILMAEVNGFIQQKMKESQQSFNVVTQNSTSDEILKYKKLLDTGIINQQEFDSKKRQLLGL